MFDFFFNSQVKTEKENRHSLLYSSGLNFAFPRGGYGSGKDRKAQIKLYVLHKKNTSTLDVLVTRYSKGI